VFLWRALHGQPVIVFGDGGVVRDYLFIGDLSRAICSMLDHQGPSCIFNVGSGRGLSVNELIDHIGRLLGFPVKVERREGRPFDVPEVVLDTGLLQSETGWRPRVPMEEGLRYTLDWLVSLKGREIRQFPGTRS
jgi:UDP-glucose 4-epimerase